LLRCHVLVQDMIVQTVCNSGLGLLAVGMVGLFAIHPLLPVAVLVGLLALVGYLLRIASGKHSKLRERLASVTATKPKTPKSDPCSQPPLSQQESSRPSPPPPAASPAVNATAQDRILVVEVDQPRDVREEDNDDSDEEKGDRPDSDEEEEKDDSDEEEEEDDSDEEEEKDDSDEEEEEDDSDEEEEEDSSGGDSSGSSEEIIVIVSRRKGKGSGCRY
jgi:type IV secretory pathway VirB10-like protein